MMPVTAYVNESADVLAPGCTVAYGRGGAQDSALHCAPRTEESDWGNRTPKPIALKRDLLSLCGAP